MTKKSIAACGLDCAKCGAYLALQNNDDELRIKTAREWTHAFGHDFAPEDINCVGCAVKEGIHGGYCDACPLRACTFENNISNCFACAKFSNCQKVKDFEKQSGMSVKANFVTK